jgi:hypothetical protein
MAGPWFLYLDESGDLGFSPDKRGRSRFFTVCILAISTSTRHRTVALAVQKTIKRKLNPKRKRKRIVQELKGNATNLNIKEYFFRQVAGVHFGIYALTLNKERLFPELQNQKERLYNYLARLILEQLPFESADEAVNLVLDKRKRSAQIQEFNRYIKRQIGERIPPKVRLRITHEISSDNFCLQAADLFSWGIFRKYEREDPTWYEIFRGKVRYDDVYLPPKK